MRNLSAYKVVTSVQKVQLFRGLALLATLGLLAIAAPLVWAAVSAAVGIMGLVGIIVVGVATFQVLPVLLQKMENHVLQLRKNEARTNPIEQLQNEMLRRAERLQVFRRALVTVGGQIETIRELLQVCQQRDPTHALERHQRALNRLQQFHEVNLARLAKAQAALEEFRSMVERKSGEWRIALAISEASELLDPHATDNLLQDLLTDTALRTVQERFNSVFAELDVQMSSLDSPTRKFLADNGCDYGFDNGCDIACEGNVPPSSMLNKNPWSQL